MLAREGHNDDARRAGRDARSAAMSLSGAVCSVMLYSNLAYGVTNQVTLEFSTPHNVAPDGILLCATADDHRFDRSTFVVNKLEEGGSQFVSGTSQTVADASTSALLSVRALSGASAWNHRPVEVGVAADVLGMDPHYASTYIRRRYDDLTVDAAGTPLDGVFQDPSWSDSAADRLAATDAVVNQLADDADLTDTERVVLLRQLAELNRPGGNCALLTGTWYADTRYELTFSAPNPALGSAATALGWWMAPLSYASPSDEDRDGAGGMEGSARVSYAVRGDKSGTVCGLRSSVSSALHDACAVLTTGGSDPTTAAAGDASACAAANAAANDPLAVAGQGVPVGAGACATGQVRSYRFSGHCVTCTDAGGTAETVTDTDGVTSRDACSCPATKMTLRAGASACGSTRGPAGTATSEGALAAELCATFSGVKEALDGGAAAGATAGVGGGIAAGAHAVAAAYVDAFLSAGSSLVDAEDVAAANATYRASMMFDERAPNDPTRRLGIAPNCQSCGRDAAERGTFVDDYGVVGKIKDVRFDAGHALRLIGYVLKSKGYPCDELYDEDDPYKSVVGTYEAAPLCEAAVPA